MVKKVINEYNPDYVSAPGETLYDVLVSMNMSQADLSRRTGLPVKKINEIIKGQSAITPATALRFEKVLGISADFWNNREKQYDKHIG